VRRVLVLGGAGMLGHKVLQIFGEHCEVAGTFRVVPAAMKASTKYRGMRIFEGIDVWDRDSVKRAIDTFRPHAIINCVGLIKQLHAAKQPKPSIYLNALFPHLLNEMASQADARLVHVSTDCVFDGCKGDYTESDPPTAVDLYGRTKFLGEVHDRNALTLRTSIIGHELDSSRSLVDWFLSQSGKVVSGYAKVVYTGLPTVVLCKELWRILENFPALCGLHQISSEKITKYDLLKTIQDVYGLQVDLNPVTSPIIDRSLDSASYRAATGFRPKSWGDMVKDMHADYVHCEYGRLVHKFR